MADAVIDAMVSQIAAVKNFYREELVNEFRDLGFWGKDNIEKWIKISLPVVDEAEQIIVDIVDSYMDVYIQGILGDFSTRPTDRTKVTGAATRNGADPSEVYARPFKPIWQGVGRGLSVDESLSHGVSRLSNTFNLDIERVADLVSIERFANEEKIVGHKRVLTGVRNCALCIVASTQLYRKSELKPIHPGCKCRTVPVISFENPNHILDGDLLEQVHSGVQKQFGISARDAREIDYRKILVTRQHGEYGPTLTYARYHFTGPGGLKTPGE